MSDYSFIANAHPSYIDDLYKSYREDPQSVEEGWRTFFKGFDYGGSDGGAPSTNGVASSNNGHVSNTSESSFKKEVNVLGLIKAYRNRGHLEATTNPLKARKDRHANLSLEDFELTEADLDTTFQAGIEVGLGATTLRNIVDHMREGYCGNIGYEYHHLGNREKRRWIRQRIEQGVQKDFGLSEDIKLRILDKLNGAVGFESFLGKKYVGQKRFSLEGGESAIAALDAGIRAGANQGVEEVVIGMAHRGRLNVLANIMGKTYEQIFKEFEATEDPGEIFGDGDVKYHLGFSSQVETPSGKSVHLKLVPNPSHLESVDPVVQGFARAKADSLYGSEYDKILPILIHGDAAVAGQGVVYEVVQMSQLNGYSTGGTIHFVINNQIGFTTDWDDARSSTYCTAASALVQAPVLHVNGDDVEAVVFAMQFAVDYRQKFNGDVFIDMVCYRKHGHNEGDDPKFTQPHLYELINDHPDPRQVYVKKLIERGELSEARAKELEDSFNDFLQERLDEVKQKELPYEYQDTEKAWRELRKRVDVHEAELYPDTGVELKQVDKVLTALMDLPEDFHALKKMNRLFKSANKLIDSNQMDWALAELTAYGTILAEGKDVRMSGQDVKRGTFSHRHAVLQDVKLDAEYNRLSRISDKQGEFRIFNSLLSEFAVMGFEYGYSLANPQNLVVWEAQFGDFYNGAQTIVDQYITSAESKWGRMSGLTLLLPHGMEGQGPEHSSARVERFLQQCAGFNMIVANVTKPANFFHLLRRQLAWDFRKPLVVMSPKSLLRHPEVISDKSEFGPGTSFTPVYDDPAFPSTGSGQAEKTALSKVRRVVLCSGKVYYDLLDYQRENKVKDVAVVRVEQLYPLPAPELAAIFKKYSKAEVCWVQEESENMGAWRYMKANYCPDMAIRYIGRPATSSPATGFKKRHEKQQVEIIAEAFAQ